MLPIEFMEERFELHPDRALWWPAERAVVIADLHMGKGATFRARGLPVPTGSTARDLERLGRIVDALSATRVIVVGDLVHASESEESLLSLCEWRESRPALALQLVAGNHDRHVCSSVIARAIDIPAEPHLVRGIALTHAPHEAPTTPTIAGHIHPTVRLEDFDGSGVNVPAFVLDRLQLVLPAFGSLTGGRSVPRAPGRRLFAVAAGRVVEAR